VQDDATADAVQAEADVEAEAAASDDADGRPAGLPDVVTFEAQPPLEPAALDAYGLRLIASRKLYDRGTLVQESPSLAGLAPGTVLRVNQYDFDRLGVSVGHQVRIKSSTGTLMAEIVVDQDVPRGSAAVYVNQDGIEVTHLIDATERVTDVRVDTGASA
jgi:predicted molibdopterin-dependent oxidoreductase YjgC